MFSLFSQGARFFRGPMEEMQTVRPVAALRRLPRVAALGPTRGGHAGVAAARVAGADEPLAGDVAQRAALSAYAELVHPTAQRHPLRCVADIMHPGLITIADSATVAQAWHVLVQSAVAQAPVVNAAGAPVGLFALAELLQPERLPTPQAHVLVWHALLAQSVQDLMWTPLTAVAPETDLRRLARVLLDTGLPGLPVLDAQDQPLGFVSRTDLLLALVADPPLDLWT